MNITSIPGIKVGIPTLVVVSCKRQCIIPEGVITFSNNKRGTGRRWYFVPAGNADKSTVYNKIMNATQHDGFEIEVTEVAESILLGIRAGGRAAWIRENLQ